MRSKRLANRTPVTYRLEVTASKDLNGVNWILSSGKNQNGFGENVKNNLKKQTLWPRRSFAIDGISIIRTSVNQNSSTIFGLYLPVIREWLEKSAFHDEIRLQNCTFQVKIFQLWPILESYRKRFAVATLKNCKSNDRRSKKVIFFALDSPDRESLVENLY